MKRCLIVFLLLAMTFSLVACGRDNSASTHSNSEDQPEEVVENQPEEVVEEEAEEKQTESSDDAFIDNLSNALYARWEITDAFSEEKLETMSGEDLSKVYSQFIEAEYEALGSFEDYSFIDEDLKEIAEMYFNGLELQHEGIRYIATDDLQKQEDTWGLGYYMRAAAVSDLYYKQYGLSVKNPYKASLAEFATFGKEAKAYLEGGVEPETDLPPTVDMLKTEGFVGEMGGVKAEMWIVPEASWNDEVVAYRFTNTTSNDLLVGLQYTGYTQDGYSVEWGVGSTMYLKAGESGVDYISPLSDEVYYFEGGINTRNADAKTKETFESISSEEYIDGGEVNYTIFFPSDGLGNFKYVIAYTDASGKIVACDALNGGTSNSTWSDSFIAPEASYEKYETSVHDTSL